MGDAALDDIPRERRLLASPSGERCAKSMHGHTAGEALGNESTIAFEHGDKYALLNKLVQLKELSLLALKNAVAAAKSLAS